MSGKWLDFYLEPPVVGRKTDRWLVYAKGGGQLGQIHWFGAWRKYAFYPLAETLYEPTCLRDIATFIEDRMAERAQQRKAAKA